MELQSKHKNTWEKNEAILIRPNELRIIIGNYVKIMR